MKVRELLEILETHDPDAEVLAGGEDATRPTLGAIKDVTSTVLDVRGEFVEHVVLVIEEEK